MNAAAYQFRESRIPSWDGTHLAFYVWEKPDARGTVLIAHGMAEYGKRYERFIQDMAETGWSFAAFDWRGHGYSEGARMRMAGIDDAVGDLGFILREIDRGSGNPSRRVVLLGHSFGGLVSVLYATTSAHTLTGLILSSPALGVYPVYPFLNQIVAFLYKVFPDKIIPKPVIPQYLTHDPNEQRKYLSDDRIYKFTGVDFLHSLLQGIKRAHREGKRLAIPLLAIVAEKDRVVDNKKILAWYGQLNAAKKELYVCKGFYHETLNELGRREPMSRIARFLSEIK